MVQRRTWAGAIRSPGGVRGVLEDINQQGITRSNTTALAELIQPAGEIELRPDVTRLLPVDEQIASLLPWPGLPRGSTIAAVGPTSLLLTLVAGVIRDGGWAAYGSSSKLTT